MQNYVKYLLPLLLVSLLFIMKCARSCGIEYSDGTQGEVEVVDLPQPSAPSQVFGIGAAMAADQDVLLFRQTRKSSSLAHNERNFFFITKLMESYSPKVKVIELSNSVSYPQGDFFMDVMDRFPGNGYGVIRKEEGGYKLYRSTFGYGESYETLVTPVQESIEKVLGPSGFDKARLISHDSRYEPYTKAMREKKSLIMYSFADACGNLPPAEQRRVEQAISQFGREAEILKVDHKAYTDPANELFAKANNTVCVFNARNRKTSPVLFSGVDVAATIRKLLDER